MAMIDPDKLARIYAAVNVIRDEALPTLAIIFPATAIVDGAAIAAISMVEEAVSLVFEAASVAESHSDPDAAREALTVALQAKAQAALDAKFGGGQ